MIVLLPAALARATPIRVALLPQNAQIHCNAMRPCVQPTVDGHVSAAEYADGRMFPLQDFTKGGANGQLFLMVSDNPSYTATNCNSGPPPSPTLSPNPTNPCLAQRLFIGLRLARPLDGQGNPINSTGTVRIWLDANRNDTLNGVPGANLPRGEDRMLSITYNTTSTPTVTEYLGTGTSWTPVTSSLALWSDTVYQRLDPLDPTEILVEVGITLRPVFSFGGAEPLTSRVLGLGIQHTATTLGAIGLPVSGAGSFPSSMTPPTATNALSWATLDLSSPAPIPLSFATWNVGQMVSAYPNVGPVPWPGIGNGGSASPHQIAADIVNSNKETICLDEVWEESEREDIVNSVNAQRKVQGMPPMNVVYEQNDEVFALPTNTTGMILLTTRPIIASAIHHYAENLCGGWDCWQHKGLLWARLALSIPVGRDVRPVDSRDFIDVFCTHVQAGDHGDSDDTTVRHDQFVDMMRYIHEVRTGGPLADTTLNRSDDQFPTGSWLPGLDRPAILMGDLNTPGAIDQINGVFKMTDDFPDATDYTKMIHDIGADMPTEFELSNSLFSDTRDLNMTVAGMNSELSATWLGDSTVFPDGICHGSFTMDELIHQARYDYVFVIPPEDNDELPTFAIAKNPIATVNAHFDGAPNFTCMSDHAEVDISFGFVRISDTLKFNPSKPHRAALVVTHIKDDASGGCCADWYNKGMLITSPTLGTQLIALPPDDAYEGDQVSPNWTVQTGPGSAMPDLPAGFQGRVSGTLALWESDFWSDDHYDSIAQGGNSVTSDDLDMHMSYFANTGQVALVAGTGANLTVPTITLGNLFGGLSPDIVFTTEGNNQDTGDNAAVTFRFALSELDP